MLFAPNILNDENRIRMGKEYDRENGGPVVRTGQSQAPDAGKPAIRAGETPVWSVTMS